MMTPQFAIGLASCVAALLFFAAGFMSARQGALVRLDRAPAPPAPPELVAANPAPPGRRTPRAIDGSASTEQALTAVLDRLGAVPGMRAVALADDMGLLIAGVGEAANQLAAYGALLRGIAHKGRELLPLAAFQRIEVEDEHSLSVYVHPLRLRDADLALVTLTAGSSPSEREVARALSDAAGVLR